jgi:hypothetical protein
MPLELLTVSASEEGENTETIDSDTSLQGPFYLKFACLGRNSYVLMLWASSRSSQQEWLRTIRTQQLSIREKSRLFEAAPISKAFLGAEKVNCVAPYSEFFGALFLLRFLNDLLLR